MAHLRWLAGCAVCVTLASAPARADEVIWLSAEFPPLAMPNSDSGPQGYMDLLRKRLVDTLPQHSIHEEVLPWPRVLYYMAQVGGPYCTAMAARTPERERFLRFTPPYGYVFPIGVVIRSQDQALYKPYLNKDGELQLHEVLGQGELRMGIAGLRSYGGVVDELLKPLVETGARHLVQVQQDNSTKSLINMLHKSRFDYTLAYPGEMVFFNGKDATLHFFPIAGNSALVSGHLSCTKSPQTDRMFGDLLKITPALRRDATLRAAYEQWLPPYLLKTYRQRLARQLANPGD
nr:hypothetical protein [uncultured Rhodoferax sp.]